VKVVLDMQYKKHDFNAYPELVVGAWVHARTIEGHIVSGFIDRRDNIDATAMVLVQHACCNQVGVVAWANLCDVEIATDSKLTDTEGYIRNMIDWALTDRDEAAFNQYTEELRKLKEIQSYRRVVIVVS
jgi:hypothetical protein